MLRSDVPLPGGHTLGGFTTRLPMIAATAPGFLLEAASSPRASALSHSEADEGGSAPIEADPPGRPRICGWGPCEVDLDDVRAFRSAVYCCRQHRRRAEEARAVERDKVRVPDRTGMVLPARRAVV